ncbi:iron-sulfur cluster assembly 2 homolog, mitochondrial [Trichonephila clavata]|uniref:Iron-sulfur cluster assembly 2 homolog, mitochondrial n=1 Tax=Trichonephila clavata TaxID=2740835 RepID=A0A8X6K6F3_TRICU|nr:iron-sulfur cluster assembly 2 homolog, mitochondrial [Trichonephila clavata]
MIFSLLKSICIRIPNKSTFFLQTRLIIPRISCNNSSSANVSENNSLKISESCVNRLKQIASDGVFLRITIDGGGCSGFQYKFDLDSELKADDVCFSKEGAKIVVDKMSLDFLRGSTVEYKEELIRSSFRIVDNPQAESKCSCGSSFAAKMA